MLQNVGYLKEVVQANLDPVRPIRARADETCLRVQRRNYLSNGLRLEAALVRIIGGLLDGNARTGRCQVPSAFKRCHSSLKDPGGVSGCDNPSQPVRN